MPKKINSHGNMQEYVPAGNGDASGEYGNSEGNNKHFKTFKKPNEESEPIISKTNKNINENIENAFKRSDYYKNTQDTHITDFTKKIIEFNDENSMKVLNKMLEENETLRIHFGNAGRNAAGCAWGYNGITLGNTNVHVFNHEIGHTWDSFYGKDMKTNVEKYPMSFRLVTQWIDNSEHKSFDEVIHEELGINGYDTVLKGYKLTYKKRGVDKHENKVASVEKMAELYNELGNKLLEEKTGIKNAYQVKIDLRKKQKETTDEINAEAENDNIVSTLKQDYEVKNKQVYREESRYANDLMKKGVSYIIYSNSPEVVKARNERDEARNKYISARDNKREELSKIKGLTTQERETLEKISNSEVDKEMQDIAGIMGDTQDYLGVSRARYMTSGHGSHYFSQRKDDGYSAEVWANIYACYLNKDKRQYETVKKMLPRTVKLFEEAIEKFGKGE